MQDFHSYSCPYCGEELSVGLDLSGGAKQSFVTDCEVCCKPIQVSLVMNGDQLISFSAEPENS